MKYKNGDWIIVQIYIDDILFGATYKSLYKEFENYTQRIWDKHDGRIDILPLTLNQTRQR